MKKFLKAILILVLIVGFIFVGIKSFNNTDNEEPEIPEVPKPDVDYTNYITNISESNPSQVKEFITEGMNFENYKETLSKIAEYVEKTKEEYTRINYYFEKHYRYEELVEIYKELNNSSIVKLEVIGKPYDGRNIYSIEIGTGNDTTMYEGNIHAAEIAPALFLTKYAIDLVNKWESNDAETRELLAKHKIVIVPTINPDGYNYSLFGKETITNQESYIYQNDNKIEQDYYKANLNGVDLNRNFPSQTGGLVFTE